MESPGDMVVNGAVCLFGPEKELWNFDESPTTLLKILPNCAGFIYREHIPPYLSPAYEPGKLPGIPAYRFWICAGLVGLIIIICVSNIVILSIKPNIHVL